MKHEGAVLDHEMARDTRKATDDLKALRSEKFASESSALAKSTDKPAIAASKRTWNEQIRGFLSDLAKRMEGDQEYHKYRDM